LTSRPYQCHITTASEASRPGRHHVGIHGRHHLGTPGRLHRNPQEGLAGRPTRPL